MGLRGRWRVCILKKREDVGARWELSLMQVQSVGVCVGGCRKRAEVDAGCRNTRVGI